MLEFSMILLITFLKSNERAIDLTRDFETRNILQKLDDEKIAKDRSACILATGTELLALICARNALGVAALIATHVQAYPEILDFEPPEVSPPL